MPTKLIVLLSLFCVTVSAQDPEPQTKPIAKIVRTDQPTQHEGNPIYVLYDEFLSDMEALTGKKYSWMSWPTQEEMEQSESEIIPQAVLIGHIKRLNGEIKKLSQRLEALEGLRP